MVGRGIRVPSPAAAAMSPSGCWRRRTRAMPPARALFNAAHYALRPWPWIIVGLASLIVFPDVAALEREFPHVPSHFVKEDLAYPAMLTLLPAG